MVWETGPKSNPAFTKSNPTITKSNLRFVNEVRVCRYSDPLVIVGMSSTTGKTHISLICIMRCCKWILILCRYRFKSEGKHLMTHHCHVPKVNMLYRHWGLSRKCQEPVSTSQY